MIRYILNYIQYLKFILILLLDRAVKIITDHWVALEDESSGDERSESSNDETDEPSTNDELGEGEWDSYV